MRSRLAQATGRAVSMGSVSALETLSALTAASASTAISEGGVALIARTKRLAMGGGAAQEQGHAFVTSDLMGPAAATVRSIAMAHYVRHSVIEI